MDQVATFVIVGAAALYLAARTWRLVRPAVGALRPDGRSSGGGCGCASAKAGCPATKDMADRIRAAVRAGAPPRV